MILSIVIIILLGVIAFFHYTQGLWSATLSAMCAILAAVIAFGYHENVVNSLLAGAMADTAHAAALIGLFALTYLILRIMFDTMVPGNVRLPPTLDKVGGALMGVVAGIFGTGIVALAAQAMPFGVSVGGHTRYPTEGTRDVQVQLAGGRAAEDITVNDELEEQVLEPGMRKKLMVPVDDLVVATVSKLSDGGSLAGSRTVASVHPDYLDELFFQRLGVQTGAKRSALNVGGKEQVEVTDVFRIDGELRQVDAEMAAVRSRPVTWPAKAPNGQTFLVVRTFFKTGAGDEKDDIVRLSPGAVRLVANGVNYLPIGTLEGASLLFANKADDPVFVPEGAGADFVFVVDTTDVLQGDPKEQQKINDGVFIEVKRLARVDLSGKPAAAPVKASEKVSVMRKPSVLTAAKVPPPAPAPEAAPPAPAAPTPAPADPAAP